MATKGIAELFAKYGARLKNVNWSVPAWNSTGELMLSFCAHSIPMVIMVLPCLVSLD